MTTYTLIAILILAFLMVIVGVILILYAGHLKDRIMKKLVKKNIVKTTNTGRICGWLGCKGRVLHTEGKFFWSDMCEKCGWGSGGSK